LKPLLSFWNVSAVRICFCAFAIVGMLAAKEARANGDDFFNNQPEVFDENGNVIRYANGYYGVVKDDRGDYVYLASLDVIVTVPLDSGPQRVPFKIYTDILGRYRTPNINGLMVELFEINFEIDPSLVELVGVVKEGYVEARRLNRGRLKKDAPREVDFIMKRLSN